MNSGEKGGALEHVTVQYSSVKEFMEFQKEKGERLGLYRKLESQAPYFHPNSKTNGDFFPYISRNTIYLGRGGSWAGFFTTRPWLKKKIQDYGHIIRNFESMAMQKVHYPPHDSKLLQNFKFLNLTSTLRKAHWHIGVLAHHDAITGVSKQKVVNDYVQTAQFYVEKIIYSFLNYLNIPQEVITGAQAYKK